MYGFDENGADLAGEFGAKVGNIVELHKLDARDNRAEGFAVLGLVGRRHGAKSAAMKALLEGEEFRADLFTFIAENAGMCASQFEGALPSLCAGIGKESTVESRALGEQHGKFSLALVVVEIRCVNKRVALAGNGLFNRWMAVTQRVDADAAQQVEIAVTLLVDDVYTLAAHKQQRVAFIGGKQQPLFCGTNLIQFRQFLFSWSLCPADR